MSDLFFNINPNLMTKNMNEPRLGVAPQVDIINDLPSKNKFTVDSFFVIGRIEEDGHKINYLFHIMYMKAPIPIPSLSQKWQVAYSIMDESTGYYVSGDHIYKHKEAIFSEDYFKLKLPNAEMSGTWDKMKIYLKEDEFEIDTESTAVHYPVLTRGSSVFDIFGMVIHQYSIPYMKTTGTVKVQGKTYNLNGENAVSWFDRQWQMQNFKLTTAWTWMAIYLENGDIISVIDCVGETDTPRFMTILKTDGSLIHSTNIKPFAECEKRNWTSEKSKQTYGTLWDLEFPDFDAKLHVEPVIEKQEVLSSMNKLSKYEGSANVTGTYEGKPIKGRATVEIIKI